MSHYLRMIIFAFIILPITVQSSILMPPQSITASYRITCYSSNTPAMHEDYQLCAFRVYCGRNTWNQPMDFTVRDGIWYTNSFRQLTKRCHGFSESTDVGIGRCPPLPYETFQNMTICICATSFCNIDLTTCINSNRKISLLQPLATILDDISNPVICSGVERLFPLPRLCLEHAFINASACVDYIRSNSVLCSISIVEGMITRESLTADNYERALIERYRETRMGGNTVHVNFTETFMLFTRATPMFTDEICLCNTFQNCNANIKTCTSPAPTSTTTVSTTSTSTTTSTTTSMTTSTVLLTASLHSNSITEIITIPTTTTITVTFSTSTSTTSITTSTISYHIQESFNTAIIPKEIFVTPVANTQTQEPRRDQTGVQSVTTVGIICGTIIILAVLIIFSIFIHRLCCRNGPDGRGSYQIVRYEA